MGTSSTKVVVRDLALNQAFAVPFDEYAPLENCYLLPTALSVDQHGQFSFDLGDLRESDIKQFFIRQRIPYTTTQS